MGTSCLAPGSLAAPWHRVVAMGYPRYGGPRGPKRAKMQKKGPPSDWMAGLVLHTAVRNRLLVAFLEFLEPLQCVRGAFFLELGLDHVETLLVADIEERLRQADPGVLGLLAAL